MAKLLGKEGNKATLEFIISKEDFKKGIEAAYNKTKNRYSVPGFRKGKAPRKVIENNYGKGIFYEDAINEILPDAYESAIIELDLDVVSKPDIDIKEFEDDKDIVIEAKVELIPEIELPDYEGLECKVEFEELDESVVDELIEEERRKNSRLVPVEDKVVEEGDTVIIDFAGTIDGVEFDGGTSKNHSLEIGSKSFIPGFEDQIVGKKAGEEFDVNVTFPETYHSEDLAGKDAVFAVKLHEVKVNELPELNDEFIEEISEFDTVEEYKADLYKQTKEGWDQQLEAAKKNAALEALADIVVIDVPEAMVENEIDEAIKDMDYRFRMQGFSLDQYMQMTGMQANDLREQFRDNAGTFAKHKIVLKAMMDKLNIEVSEEEIEEELKFASEEMGESLEYLKDIYSEDGAKKSLVTHIKTKKVFDELLEKLSFEIVEPVKEEDVVNAEKVIDAVMEQVEDTEETEEDAE